MTKGIFLKFILLFLSTLISWLFAEFVIYILLCNDGFYWQKKEISGVTKNYMSGLVKNHRRIFSYQPGFSQIYYSDTEKQDIGIKINSAGFRDIELSTRDKASLKFLALGDSFTFGWLVDVNKRWDNILARELTASTGKKIEAVNAGLWNTTFDQHAVICEEMLQKDYIAIIHLVYPSHIRTINRHCIEFKDGQIRQIVDPFLYVKDGRLLYGKDNNSLVSKELWFPFSICKLRFNYRRNALNKLVSNNAENVTNIPDIDVYTQEGQKSLDNGWQMTELSIRTIATLAKRFNVPYYIVLVPRSLQLSPLEWQFTEPKKEVIFSSIPQERLVKMCNEIGGISVFDPLSIMRKNYHPDWYFSIDPHWTTAGHQVMAELIAKKIFKIDPAVPLEQSKKHTYDRQYLNIKNCTSFLSNVLVTEKDNGIHMQFTSSVPSVDIGRIPLKIIPGQRLFFDGEIMEGGISIGLIQNKDYIYIKNYPKKGKFEFWTPPDLNGNFDLYIMSNLSQENKRLDLFISKHIESFYTDYVKNNSNASNNKYIHVDKWEGIGITPGLKPISCIPGWEPELINETLNINLNAPSPYNYLFHLPDVNLKKGDVLSIKGQILEGGISFGLITASHKWYKLQTITERGPFRIDIDVLESGKYSPYLAAYVSASNPEIKASITGIAYSRETDYSKK